MSYTKQDVEIGIIGGTGADIKLENAQSYKVYTPYGAPSAKITIGEFAGKKVAFLPRHGEGHVLPPHKVNYRANIWALKSIGVKRIISPCAVGGLREEMDKGVFVIVDQYIDRTKGREDTFYDGGEVCHIGQADPFCPEVNEVFYKAGKDLGIDIKKGGTYVCVNGPRFSTRAESNMFRMWGGDVIGMTLYPEVVLASEQNMCYTSIATVTDLDCWAMECKNCNIIVPYGEKCPKCGQPATPLVVSVEEILDTMKKNEENLRKLLEKAIPEIPSERHCNCGHARDGAIL
ncbi:MAG: S-methyl-5'-thioadenosine phosphorylase [Promethearchaeota archaeon]